MKKKELISFNDISAHKKKSKTASQSDSKKRSDHKHDYEKVIIEGLFGFQWGKHCTICGRIDDYYSHFSTMNREGLLSEERLASGLRYKAGLTIDEIREHYPDIRVFQLNQTTGDYEMIE